MCECEHFDKYAEARAYATMLRETVAQTRESAREALAATNGYVAQVQQLKQVNHAMMIKMGRQENQHIEQLKAMEAHYKKELAELKQRCQQAMRHQEARHVQETLEMIGVMEQMKAKILTLGQKTEQDRPTSGSPFDRQSVASGVNM